MKILVVHNRYRIRTGEDNTFDQEVELLKKYKNEVLTWTPDNRDIKLTNFIDNAALGLNTIWSQSFHQTICQILDDFQPSIVHVHNIIPLVSPSIFYACKSQGIPVVKTIHNYRLGCPAVSFFRDGKVCELCLQKSLFQSIRYRCYRNSHLQTAAIAAMLQVHRWLKTWQNAVDGYIAVSQFLKDKLIEIGIPSQKIYLKPNFISANKSENTINQFGSYYIFVGRLIEEKGIRLLLQGYQLAKSQFPLVIIGSGELEDLVKKEAEKNPMIRYQGQQSKSQVLEWMQGAIALIFPSIWYECSPMTILEAYSRSLPVISTNIGSLAEMIKPHQTGLLFSPTTPQSLAKIIKKVESQPQEWIQLKQNLLGATNPIYFSELNYQCLMEIYKRVIETKTKAK